MEPDNRLRELRKAAGLTQVQLADRTGVSQAAISHIESGIQSMDLHWMRAFARALCCRPADLLLHDDNPDRLDEIERALVESYRQVDDGRRRLIKRVFDVMTSDLESEDARHIA